MTTQCEMVLKHLKSGRTMTPIDALNEYGIFRLASRVLELRVAGHDIVTHRVADGEKCHAKYQLRASRD